MIYKSRGEVSMEAGRELDALVAEKVMGLSFYQDEDDPTLLVVENKIGNEIRVGELPNFSTDIAAAWDVVETLKTKNLTVCLYVYPGDNECTVIKDDTIDGVNRYRGSSMPYLICMAALKAVEGKS